MNIFKNLSRLCVLSMPALHHTIRLSLLCGLMGQAAAAPVELITPSEMQASMAAPVQLMPKSVPVKDAPKIQIMKPTLPGTVTSPTPIVVKFDAVAPAIIKPESFRVSYGNFSIDITKRLLSAAPVTIEGLQLQEAALPKGKHKLNLLIEDTLGRKASQQVELDVQ